MEIKNVLFSLGLSKHEQTTYLHLVRCGAGTVAAIAAKTKLPRSTVYQVLPELQRRGLVATIQKGARTLYLAESPEKLESLFRQTEIAFYQFLPELKAAHESQEKRPMAKFLEGKQGIQSIFDDLVKTLTYGDVFYRYSSAKGSRDEYLPRGYRELRDAKKLERFVITNRTQSERKKQRMERAMKIVPDTYGLFDQDITQVIYGSKVAFIDYGSETAVLIENRALAAFQTRLFRVLYDLL
jgi:sugar-specific transcriptional regulator TrmB